MLEQAAGCLKVGGRRLLRESKRPTTSRRALHAAFWYHGAADLDLQSWCTTMLERVEPVGSAQPCATSSKSQGGSSSAPGALLLDFLYPAQTLALIKHFSACTSEHSRSHRKRIGAQSASRSYSSLAVDTVRKSDDDSDLMGASSNSFQPHERNTSDTALLVTKQDRGPGATDLLRELLRANRKDNYEEAWRLYCEKARRKRTKVQSPELWRNQSDKLLVAELLEYFSTSTRLVDAERSVELFESLPEAKPSKSVYTFAIAALMKLGRLDEAIELNRIALGRVKGPFWTESLFTAAVEKGDWPHAMRLREDLLKYSKDGYGEALQSWLDVERLPHFADLALKLANFTEAKLRTLNPDKDESEIRRWKEFTATFQLRASLTQGMGVDRHKIFLLLDELKELSALSHILYHKIMSKLLLNGQGELATQIYDHYLQSRLEPAPLVQDLYEDALSLRTRDRYKFRRTREAQGYQTRTAMNHAASRGDAATVYKLFTELSSQLRISDQENKIENLRMVNIKDVFPLLYVHARRGEVKEAAKQFSRISEEYHLTPNLDCWNVLIHAYTRIEDVKGAYRCFKDLLAAGIKPDEYTFGPLMGLSANRGDIGSVRALLEQAKSMGIKETAPMIGSLVLAYANNNQLEEAEKHAELALTADLKGSKTGMWNTLLTAYALRRDVFATSRIHQRMREAEIPLDGGTYGTVLQTLAMDGHRLESAFKLISVVMPREGITVTASHYAIVMGGFWRTQQPERVVVAHKRMMKRRIKPSLATQVILLKAIAQAETKNFRRERSVRAQESVPESGDILAQTEELLDRMLQDSDASEVAPHEPLKGISKDPIDEAYPSAYFEYLMFCYAKNHNAFDKVGQLYERYLKAVRDLRADGDVKPSIKILTALMISNLRQRRYDDVSRSWALAKLSADRQALNVPLNAGTTSAITESTGSELPSQGQYVLPARRYALALPLNYYLQSLFEADQINVAISVVDELLARGYALTNTNWNTYVQILARKNVPILAFQVCEKALMPGWRGWHVRKLRRGRGSALLKEIPNKSWALSPLRHSNLSGIPDSNQYASSSPATSTSSHAAASAGEPLHLNVPADQADFVPSSVPPPYLDKLSPNYRTMVYLAGALLECRSRALANSEFEHVIATLNAVAPLAVRAVKIMPRIDDDLQADVLARD
ncbi:MAG: hypothetical protein M1819_004664 [Sarea resinae]|nr:MAG: hypothetical protein M1819_004664 [Sarea resinae]